jgi:hypothetical protein
MLAILSLIWIILGIAIFILDIVAIANVWESRRARWKKYSWTFLILLFSPIALIVYLIWFWKKR